MQVAIAAINKNNEAACNGKQFFSNITCNYRILKRIASFHLLDEIKPSPGSIGLHWWVVRPRLTEFK